MRNARGLLIAGTLVAVLEASTGVVGLAVLGPERIAFFLIACAGATSGVTVLAWLASSRGRGDDDDGGGGEPSTGPPPWGPRSEGEQPPWWPEFERDFWRHVGDRPRTPS